MSELAIAIESACDNMRRVLDDDWSDAMDREVMAIADLFGIDDLDWIEKQIKAELFR